MEQPGTLILIMAMAVLAPLLAPRDLTAGAERPAPALFASTCLPLVVAITTIGLDEKVLGAGEGAALVAAATVSVLTFPLPAFRLLRRGVGAAGPGAPFLSAESTDPW
ncbi:hypothetical protein [Streptomyces sp. NPDC060054]|uniref:hypothetical protein n=1 Tax=unclassified Streptomyces TaxID=2593676 RepID=UPI00093B0E62|nr:hypothetical protein A6A29_21075 [Streptomyces sp. TSRI0281]